MEVKLGSEFHRQKFRRPAAENMELQEIMMLLVIMSGTGPIKERYSTVTIEDFIQLVPLNIPVTGNDPVISSDNAFCKSIIIQDNAEIHMHFSKTLTVGQSASNFPWNCGDTIVIDY
jgi:hypothetical protein